MNIAKFFTEKGKSMSGFKVKSILVRWFVEVFAITAAVLVVIGISLAILAKSISYANLQRAASQSAREFSSLSSATEKTFESAGISLCENFSAKDKIEVHILNKNGKAFVSTTGFLPTTDDKSAFKSAKKQDGVYISYFRDATGKKVMQGTNIVTDQNGKTLGAFCWCVSLAKVNRQITSYNILIVAVLVVIFALFATLGIMYVNSIVKPIRNIGSVTRRIALGDFESRVDIKHEDEIGDLCDAVNYMASELKAADNMKNDFISSVSHELRTPLTAIRGWGETAKMSVGQDEELVARGLDVILSESDRLSNLVEELLDFSRMQQGRLKVTTAPIDITVLLQTVTDMYSELARKQGIELSYTPPAHNSIVMGDRDRLKQVFINIIDNAVKYTEKGGLVLVVQTRDEQSVQIQVKDTGVGIPEKDIDHVKEKFYKANQTVRGSGIGLAVADEIIKQHDGLLFLESKEGVGTTATIVLPLCEEDEYIEESEQKLAPEGDSDLTENTGEPENNNKSED